MQVMSVKNLVSKCRILFACQRLARNYSLLYVIQQIAVMLCCYLNMKLSTYFVRSKQRHEFYAKLNWHRPFQLKFFRCSFLTGTTQTSS